jgi:hypothetical protein
MAEFDSGGHHYRTERMNARDQLHLLRGLGPLFGPMARAAMLSETADDVTRRIHVMIPFFEAFSKMEKHEVDVLVDRCLSVTRRREGGGNGTSQYGPPMHSGSRDQYEDLSLGDLMTICWEVVQDNLGGFFATASPPGAGNIPHSPPLAMPMSVS